MEENITEIKQLGPNQDVIEMTKEILGQNRLILEAITRSVLVVSKPEKDK